jgi:hypothetical protein
MTVTPQRALVSVGEWPLHAKVVVTPAIPSLPVALPSLPLGLTYLSKKG